MKRSLTALFIVFTCACVRPCVSADGADDTTGTASGEAAVEALFIEGTDAYNKDRNYDRALRLMNAVLEADTNHAGALYYRAMIFDLQRKWDEATADIDRALAIDPDQPRFLYMKGRLFERQGDSATALEWYSKALEGGFHSESLRARIELRLDAAQYQKALDDCTWLLKHQPDAEAFMLRARSYLGLKQYEKALADCDYVLAPIGGIEVPQRTARNFLVRAQALLELDRLDDAYYDLIRASYLEQWWREPVLALGDYFLLHKPDLRQAIAYYTAAIEISAFKVRLRSDGKRHEAPIARLRRGQAYVKLDATLFGDLALEDFTRYIELEPGKPDGYIERAKLYIVQGETDKARADIEKALELDPGNDECKDLLKQIEASDDSERNNSEEQVQ